MDFNTKDKDPWNWHKEEDYCLEKTSNFDISQELWNEVPSNQDLSIVLDDATTPVKSCVDFAYNVNNNESNVIQKEQEECSETSSQAKRRRMLHFNAHNGNHSLSDEPTSSAYLKSNECNEDLFPEVSQWLSGVSENASASNYEDLESAEGWIAECFKDAEMQLCPDNSNFSGADDVHIDVNELCNLTPPIEQNVVQPHFSQTPRKIVFRGRKSMIQTPTKLASSVAYPFTFIKPCGVHGDVTLKEINKRIQSPPPSKSKQVKEDPIVYPKSAFSGKPVVGKTKIRTEGGKGSITIMRTRG
ncbi:protein XRI1-like isoform X2 [Cicer arietinum]|uniref:Protein XRI1-like isoform X2 n=1 Tax=Cicer arietinum TaxID=3827 RepID=A0A1S2Z1X6_CICAR|nr:protein XRI1-like isoform X2 [Cicer arietinum]